MSFLTPLGFLGALLAAPIVLLYMLRLRRTELLVSSTFLWEQVLQDNEANTPWQRLRRNLLLLLQLLILALLVFALARPFVVVPSVSQGQIVLLLDASASMSATDTPDGTRFARAQAQTLEIINTLSDTDAMTLIRVAEVPEVLVPQTNNRALLRDALNAAQPSNAPADWGAALTLAAGTAGAQAFTLVIVSDGGLGDISVLPIVDAELRYVPVGEHGGNVAISALATLAQAGQPPQLFAQLNNYGDTPAEIIFSLSVDGELFSAERYTLEPQARLPITSDALPAGFGVLEASITAAAGSATQDALSLDNQAWAVAESGAALEALLVSDGNRFLDRVLGSLPTVSHLNASPAQALPVRPFDLYIFDGTLPDVLPPSGDLLLIAPPRSVDGLFSVLAPTEETANPRVLVNDSRTRFLDFSTVNVRSFTPLTDIAWADALIGAEGGTLLYSGEIDGRQVTILPFALGDSDLPLQIAFPILMSNLMDWYRPQSAVLATNALRVGESLRVRPPLSATRIRVTQPDGTRRDFALSTSDLFIYADTAQQGVYTLQVFEDTQELQSAQFAVNLFERSESDITPRATIRLGSVEVDEAVREEVGQREFWKGLALAALLVLLLEWLLYHRRNMLRAGAAPLWRAAR